jgi:hypothetical protein
MDSAPAVSDPEIRQVSRQAAAEQGLHWPRLLADRGILTVSCLVAGLGILGLITMWLIANRLHGADRASLASQSRAAEALEISSERTEVTAAAGLATRVAQVVHDGRASA